VDGPNVGVCSSAGMSPLLLTMSSPVLQCVRRAPLLGPQEYNTCTPFLIGHTMVTTHYDFYQKIKGQNTVNHGTRYCRLNFVAIEQEMGEKIGSDQKGWSDQSGVHVSTAGRFRPISATRLLLRSSILTQSFPWTLN
jgi:hypothetical protein